MKIFNQSIKIVLVAIIAVIAYSCLDTAEEPDNYSESDELADINTYIISLKEDGHDVDTTELGVYYVVQEEGEGETPIEGDLLSFEYTGYFMDGTAFDASSWHNEDGTYQITYLVDRMVPGFEDGLALMNKGAEILMIIPSSLAYGPYDYNSIPGYSTLIFVVLMSEINPE